MTVIWRSRWVKGFEVGVSLCVRFECESVEGCFDNQVQHAFSPSAMLQHFTHITLLLPLPQPLSDYGIVAPPKEVAGLAGAQL